MQNVLPELVTILIIIRKDQVPIYVHKYIRKSSFSSRQHDSTQPHAASKILLNKFQFNTYMKIIFLYWVG